MTRGKSLGEKLWDVLKAEWMPGYSEEWADATDAHDEYERIAFAFASSLTHDDTASAVIAAQAEEIERLRGAVKDILLLRPAGPCRSKLVEQIENIARATLTPHQGEDHGKA